MLTKKKKKFDEDAAYSERIQSLGIYVNPVKSKREII